MREYTPDSWQLVRVTEARTGVSTYKILASWYGGFVDADMWKVSSGITGVIDHETHYEFPQFSNSVYMCAKTARRMSSLMIQVYDQFKVDLERTGIGTIELIADADPTSIDFKDHSDV